MKDVNDTGPSNIYNWVTVQLIVKVGLGRSEHEGNKICLDRILDCSAQEFSKQEKNHSRED